MTHDMNCVVSAETNETGLGFMRISSECILLGRNMPGLLH